MLKQLKAVTLNMGAELRKTAKMKTSIGREVAKYIDAGKIAPLKVSHKIVRNFFKKVPATQRIVFDGYPRTMAQVKLLDTLLKKHNREVLFIYLKLPMSVAKARLKKRAEIEGRHDDTDPAAIQNRIDVFNRQSKNIIRHYKNNQQLIVIDGVGSVAAVHKRIMRAIS